MNAFSQDEVSTLLARYATGMERELDEATPVRDILHHRDVVLTPTMTIKEAVAAFDRSEAEALAVVQSVDNRQVVGLLSEAYALRRYSQELELRRRELIGE